MSKDWTLKSKYTRSGLNINDKGLQKHITIMMLLKVIINWTNAGETAEMPGMYKPGDYDLAGFAVGAVERNSMLPRKQSIKPGDQLIGIASSGIHSNGYSLVRKVIENSELTFNSPSPFKTTEGLQGVTTLGEALLIPTRIYCKAILPLMKDNVVKAFAHITGEGLFCILNQLLVLFPV